MPAEPSTPATPTASTAPTAPLSGTAAGVPYLALPPATARPDAPVVVAWHLLDAPRTPEAFAAALPLAGLDAWRVFLGLPMSGARMPAGGMDEILALAAQDLTGRVHGRIALDALAEFPAAWAALRQELGLGGGPVALVGGSMGALVAQLVAVSGVVEPRGLALLSPLLELRVTLPFIAELLGVELVESPENEEVLAQCDFVARAAELAAIPRLVVAGDQDAPFFLERIAAQRDALPDTRYEEIAGMGHALADEPGLEAAPQTAHAVRVDALVTGFLAPLLR